MKTLTKETFDEAIKTGNALVFFHRDGCPNCTTVAPIIEKFNKDGVNVFDINESTEKEITLRYAPRERWTLPMVCYFENGELVKKRTGMMTADDVLGLTKTMQNISDFELQEAQIDMEIEKANLKKEMFNIDVTLVKIGNEMQRRMSIMTQDKPAEIPKDIAPADDLKKKTDECVINCQRDCKPTDEDCKAGCYKYCEHVTIQLTDDDKIRIAKEKRKKEKDAEAFVSDPSLDTQCDGCQ